MPFQNTFSRSILLLMVLALLVGGCSRLSPAPVPTAAPTAVPTPQASSIQTATPEGTLQAFLDWYASYPGSVLTDKAYKTSPYLSNQFTKYIDDMAATGYPVDPFFCSPEPPETFEVSQPEITDDLAKITLSTGEGGGLIYTLQKYGDNWLIIGNNCILPF